MARFRKKPAEFEAEQIAVALPILPGDPCPSAPPGVAWGIKDHDDPFLYPFVKTAGGKIVFLDSGDWVVREPNGDGYYPIKPDVMPLVADRID